MWEKVLNKLLSAKFLIAIMISVVLCVLALRGVVNSEAFVGIAGGVIGFYFNRSGSNHNDR